MVRKMMSLSLLLDDDDDFGSRGSSQSEAKWGWGVRRALDQAGAMRKAVAHRREVSLSVGESDGVELEGRRTSCDL